MTTINDIYGSGESKYLNAADLQKKTHSLTINRWEAADFTDDGGEKKRKIVLFFDGKKKGLALNITNARSLAYLFGDSPDGWVGKKIELYPTIVDFGGKPVEAVRVRPIAPASNDLDDDIPF